MKKRYIAIGLMVLVALATVYFFGCGKNDPAGLGDLAESAKVDLYLEQVAGVPPVFDPFSASAASVRVSADSSSWWSGNPLYSVYFSLREFVPARDEGIVDRSNLYKLIYDVSNVASSTLDNAADITEQEITPPFSGLAAVTCDKAVNDSVNGRAAAFKDTTGEVNAILAWSTTDTPEKMEYGFANVTYHKENKEARIDMVYSVDYDISGTKTDYNLRGYFEGNPETNAFQYKYIIGDVKIVGKGIARGAGNCMLFKYAGMDNAVKYIVVPGDADEKFFIENNIKQANIHDDPDDLPESVSAYKDWVTAEAFFKASDLLTDIADLNKGKSQAGTIYLNF